MKRPRFEKERRKEGETLASAAYARLRAEIIAGDFAGGSKLRIRQLCERYAVGLSPVREALNRLSRDGLVVQNDLHGFTVAPLGVEELEELTKTRCWLNERALRESIARGDAAWEEAIVLSQYRLARAARWSGDGDDATVNPEWEVAHRGFHSALIAACGSRWLVNYCEHLFDVADRYRYLSRTPAARRTRGPDEHIAIMQATLARDADRAVTLLNEHFQKTADHCRSVLISREAQSRRRSA